MFSGEGGDEGGGNRHVNHHADDVVGDGDEGAGGEGRVDFETFEGQGDKRTEHRGEHHDREQRQRHCDCRDLMPRSETEEIIGEHQQRYYAAVD